VCWLLGATVLLVVEVDKFVHWRARVRAGRRPVEPVGGRGGRTLS
jgi:hypothetical protein